MKRNSQFESGQTALMFTLMLTTLFGAAGLVTDVGWSYYRKQTAQAAAQSAALATVEAGMTNGGVCGSNNVVCQYETSCPSSIQISGGMSSTDTGCLYAQTNGYTTGSRQKVTIESGAVSVNNVFVTYWATARVSERLPLLFSVVTGRTEATLTAKATVGYLPPVNGGCIYVIAPTGAALTSNGNTQITTGCGIWVNSNASNAIDLSGGNTTITDTNSNDRVNIVGGYNCYGGTTGCITPTPNTGARSDGDPLAGLPAPTASSCTPIPNVHGNVTIDPGTYCGSISLSGGSNLTMNPGTYIFKSGGSSSCGLSTSGNASITANGVFIYYQDSCSASITGNGNVTMSAPTSGMYQGVLMFQARNNSSSSSLTGGTGQILNGILYFPADGTVLHYTGGSSSNINAQASTIVAWNLQLGGNSYIQNSGSSPYLNTFSGYAFLE